MTDSHCSQCNKPQDDSTDWNTWDNSDQMWTWQCGHCNHRHALDNDPPHIVGREDGGYHLVAWEFFWNNDSKQWQIGDSPECRIDPQEVPDLVRAWVMTFNPLTATLREQLRKAS